jgi:serine protease Do
MRRIFIAVSAGVCVIAILIAHQTLQVDIQLRESVAQARTGGDAFWVDGKGGPALGRPDSFADLAQQAAPAVVNIQVTRTTKHPMGRSRDLFEEFFGGRKHPRFRAPDLVPTEASGSGFVISEDGYIVTNNHVVEEADSISVVFSDGNELEAKVIGLDGKTDLALIKVEPEDELNVISLGNSDETRVGDWVMAIGNPFGLENTVTVGILSARSRDINAGPYDDFLQTDASINPGNSGGPLIDMKGRVIGINTAITPAGQGIGFAIPINMAKSLLPQLRATGSVTRGWLGVSIQRVTLPIARKFDLEEPQGALVSQVFEGSPAKKAEIERGDVIVEFDGAKIEDVDDLPRRVADTAPGSKVKIVVIRDGKKKKLEAVLDKMDDDAAQLADSRESPSKDWGFDVQALTPEIAEQLGFKEEVSGVLITDVDPAGAASRAGLRRGDVIVEANREEIASLEDLSKALGQDESQALLLVRRGSGTFYIAIEQEE